MLLTGLVTDGHFSLARDGKQLLYVRAALYSNLWLYTLGEDDAATVQAKQLTTGTAWNNRPSISPDGRWVAFSRGESLPAVGPLTEPAQQGVVTNIFVMPVEGCCLVGEYLAARGVNS